MLLKMAFKNNIFKLIWVTFKQYFESKFYELLSYKNVKI